MGFESIKNAARDAYDIARRAKNATELLRAVVPSLQEPRILNDGDATRLPADELIAQLRTARNELKGEMPAGRVNYETLRENAAYHKLERLAPALQHLSPDDLTTDAARTAFFINLYNVLAIHGVLALGIRESVMEIPSFFSVVRYRVGTESLSLDQIENGVLRCNAPHPATNQRTLPPQSHALRFSPSAVDPRIHSALVCASTSCPPVGFYDPEHLNDQLDLATRGYVESEVTVGDTIQLPITFHYYRADWGTRKDIEAFLLKYASATQCTELERAFEIALPFSYQRYDWSLNVV